MHYFEPIKLFEHRFLTLVHRVAKRRAVKYMVAQIEIGTEFNVLKLIWAGYLAFIHLSWSSYRTLITFKSEE